MGKHRLTTLKPRLAELKPRLAAMPSSTRAQRATSRPWERIRARILERDRGMCVCAECKALGRLLLAHEVDHVVPVWKGGTDDDANLASINRDCHKRKTEREAAERAAGQW